MRVMKTKRKQSELKRKESINDKSAVLQDALIEIVAESWRFERTLEKMLERMDPMEAERFARQYSYFSTRVTRAAVFAGLSCIDLTGQPYDVGMAVQAMNLDEFDEDDHLIIVRMIEPVILCGGHVVKTGMVMLGRTEKDK